jgi:hypothetical protein
MGDTRRWLDPRTRWTIAVDPPVIGHAARIADNRLTVVTAAVEGRRAYIRGASSLQIIEW